jgi:predicted RNA-binding protein with PUA-like domain
LETAPLAKKTRNDNSDEVEEEAADELMDEPTADEVADELMDEPTADEPTADDVADELVAESEAERLTPDLPEASPEASKTEPPKRAGKHKGGAERRKRQSSPGPALPRAKRVKINKLTEQLGGDDGPQYWLFKAEPESRVVKGKDVKFSIDDLMNVDVPEPWSGVRNHAAKNHMLAMKKGDLGLFYHSSCKVPGVVGILEVAEEAAADESAFDENDPYYDEKSSRAKPKWMCVSVAFRQKFDNPTLTTLTELKKHSTDGGALKDMMLFRQGRLSVAKVTKPEWNFILNLAGHLEHLADGETAQDEDENLVEDSQEVSGGFANTLERMIESVDQAVENIMQGVDHTAEDTVLDQTVEETILDVDQTAAYIAEGLVDELNGNGDAEIARKLPRFSCSSDADLAKRSLRPRTSRSSPTRHQWTRARRSTSSPACQSRTRAHPRRPAAGDPRRRASRARAAARARRAQRPTARCSRCRSRRRWASGRCSTLLLPARACSRARLFLRTRGGYCWRLGAARGEIRFLSLGLMVLLIGVGC